MLLIFNNDVLAIIFVFYNIGDPEATSFQLLNLEGIFFFLTGSNCIPPLGYKETKPTILFAEDMALPFVSTCALQLIFPYTMAVTYETFKAKMAEYVIGTQGFFQHST